MVLRNNLILSPLLHFVTENKQFKKRLLNIFAFLLVTEKTGKSRTYFEQIFFLQIPR